MSTEKAGELPTSVGVAVAEPCKFSRAELTAFLEKSDYGQNLVVFRVFLEDSTDGPRCRQCHRLIGAHDAEAAPASKPKDNKKDGDEEEGDPDPATGQHYPQELEWSTDFDVFKRGDNALGRCCTGMMVFMISALLVHVVLLVSMMYFTDLRCLYLYLVPVALGFAAAFIPRSTVIVVHKTDHPATADVTTFGRFQYAHLTIDASDLGQARVTERRSRWCSHSMVSARVVVVVGRRRREIELFAGPAKAAHTFSKSWAKYVAALDAIRQQEQQQEHEMLVVADGVDATDAVVGVQEGEHRNLL